MMNDNRGGLANILAVSVDNLQFEVNWLEMSVYPKIADLSKVIRIPTFAEQRYSFKETSELGDHGKRYKVEISGKFPKKMMPERDKMALMGGKWYVIHQDKNGNVLISGTEEVPMECVINDDSGEDETDMNMSGFTFSAIEREASWKCSLVDLINLENM